MKNIFGNDKVYICPHCGSDNVGAEFSFYGAYNKPYEAPSFGELTHQDSDWCYDCDEEIIVLEQSIQKINSDVDCVRFTCDNGYVLSVFKKGTRNNKP